MNNKKFDIAEESLEGKIAAITIDESGIGFIRDKVLDAGNEDGDMVHFYEALNVVESEHCADSFQENLKLFTHFLVHTGSVREEDEGANMAVESVLNLVKSTEPRVPTYDELHKGGVVYYVDNNLYRANGMVMINADALREDNNEALEEVLEFIDNIVVLHGSLIIEDADVTIDDFVNLAKSGKNVNREKFGKFLSQLFGILSELAEEDSGKMHPIDGPLEEEEFMKEMLDDMVDRVGLDLHKGYLGLMGKPTTAFNELDIPVISIGLATYMEIGKYFLDEKRISKEARRDLFNATKKLIPVYYPTFDGKEVKGIETSRDTLFSLDQEGEVGIAWRIPQKRKKEFLAEIDKIEGLDKEYKETIAFNLQMAEVTVEHYVPGVKHVTLFLSDILKEAQRITKIKIIDYIKDLENKSLDEIQEVGYELLRSNHVDDELRECARSNIRRDYDNDNKVSLISSVVPLLIMDGMDSPKDKRDFMALTYDTIVSKVVGEDLDSDNYEGFQEFIRVEEQTGLPLFFGGKTYLSHLLMPAISKAVLVSADMRDKVNDLSQEHSFNIVKRDVSTTAKVLKSLAEDDTIDVVGEYSKALNRNNKIEEENNDN